MNRSGLCKVAFRLCKFSIRLRQHNQADVVYVFKNISDGHFMEVKSVENIATDKPEAVGSQKPGSERSRKRNIIVFSVVCVLNVALLVVIGSQLLTPTNNSTQKGIDNAAVAVGEVNTPLIGKPAPAFTLSRLGGGNGAPVSLADFKGKPVVINFWASWCGPCNDEAPALQKSWLNELQQKGVVLIGINGEKSPPDAQAFMKKYSLTYLNVEDSLGGSTALNYGVTALPETIFIDRQGIVVSKVIKPLNAQNLQFEIAKVTR